MPADIEAAQSWRKANITRAKTKTTLPEMQAALREVKERARGELPESLAEAERIYSDLEAATQTARSRAAQLTGSTEPAIDELGRRWSLLAADLLARKLAVTERIQALRVQSGELVSYIEVRDTFAAFLREMRTLATAMPAAWAMRCNPSDPVMAQLALEDWIKTYFRALHQNPAGVSIANDAAPRREKNLQEHKRIAAG